MSEPGDDTRDHAEGRPEGGEDRPEGSEGVPAGRKRRRRRGRRRSASSTGAPAAGSDSALSALTTGLFSHVDEREVPCKIDGCDHTWIWSAEEQIRAFGQPPPKRMCAEHVAQFHALVDREVACVGRDCTRTWLWSRSAQVAQLQKAGSEEAPKRLCDACKKAERELDDTEVPCRIEGCSGTWRWTREARLKHRAWVRREGGSRTPDPGDPPKKRRRRRSTGDGPPARLCDRCRDKLATLIDREGQCKVHGCTRMVSVDRESQLRAWAAAGADPSTEVPLPKRMCEVCREFCRLHEDRQVPCGRPGCERTWTYKTGAQLQAFLAGRLEDPVRLCDACRETDVSRHADDRPSAPEGAEIMPCIVPGCVGVWFFAAGTTIAPAEDGDLPLDRMCDGCRVQREASPRNEGVEGEPGRASTGSLDAAHPTGETF